MGVNKLLKYARDCGLYEEVDLQQIADEFRSRDSAQPVIAVDGTHCAWFLYRKMDSLHGGQYKEFRERCKYFVKCFRGVGIGLHFFFEGPPVKEKMTVWLKGRRDNANEISKFFSKLRDAQSKGDGHISCWYVPGAVIPCATVTFKQIGCEVRSSTTDCDSEMAQFAATNRCCIGVLSNHAEFLIYHGVPCVFTFSILQVGRKVVGQRFRPAELASHLGIQVEDLPVFASLVGNNIVTEEDLQVPHENLRRIYGNKTVIQLVPELLKRSPRGDLRSMCEVAFGDNWREGLELVQKSVRSYSYDVDVSEKTRNHSRWDEVLRVAEAKHVSCEIPGYVYTVMKCRLMRCGAALENLSVSHPNSPPTGMVLRGMRARMYTVLLWDSGTGPFEVTEYVVKGLGEVCQETVEVQKRLQEGIDHPGLLELWRGPEDRRWRIFNWVISPTRDLSALRDLSPQHFVVPTGALFYLYHEAQIITMPEVRTFLIVAVAAKSFSAPQLSRLRLRLPTERAIYLATLFVCTVLHVLDVAGACGLSFPRPADCHLDSYFDGRLFHHIYSMSQHTSDPWALTAWNESREETFRSLINVIEH